VAEQIPLSLQSAGVPGQVSARADNAVAGDDDRDRVAPVRGADCARGARQGQPAGEFAVADRFAVRNLEQRGPDTSAKGGRFVKVERDVELEELAGEVSLELVTHVYERRARPAPSIQEFPVLGGRECVEAGESRLVAAQQQPADRARYVCVKAGWFVCRGCHRWHGTVTVHAV
jgi:hypothetical protein